MMFENEAISRNIVLRLKHGSIPSYALWRGMDIESESDNSRLSWWKPYINDTNTDIINESKYWINILENELDKTEKNSKLEKKKLMEEKNNNDLEKIEKKEPIIIEDHNCCTKRGYGNDLYCDI